MKDNKRTYKRRYFYKLMLFMILPTVFIYGVSFAYYSYSIEKSKSEAITYYQQSLDNIDRSIQDSMNEIKDLSSFIVYNPLARDYISYSNKPEKDDYYNVTAVKDFLTSYANANTMIDSIAIYDANNDYVISTIGTSNANLFFTEIMSYNNLNQANINDVTFTNSHYYIHPMALLNNRDLVLPLITNQYGQLFSQKIMLINLNILSLQDLFNHYKLTPNSQVTMIDEQGLVYCYSGSKLIDYDQDEHITIKKETLLFNKVFHLTATIPIKDLNDQSKDFRKIYLLTSLSILIFTFIMLYFGSKKLYSPIEKIIQYVDQNTPTNDPMNDLELIDYSIHNLVNKNLHLNENLESSSKYAKVHYLYTLLQDNVFGKQDEINEKLSDIEVYFEEDYFCVLTMQYDFYQDFYNSFDEIEQKQMLNGILKLFVEFFDDYASNIIPLDKKNIAIILNVPISTTSEEIRVTAQAIADLFINDGNMVKLKIGIGKIYQYVNGIHYSYTESHQALKRYHKTSKTVLLYDDSTEDMAFKFSYSMEHKLTNYILSGNEKAVESLLNKILNINKGLDLDTQQLNELYITIAKLLNLISNESTYVPTNSFETIDVIIDPLNKLPFDDLYDQLTQHALNISSYHIEVNTKNDINTIMTFIDEHFTEDLSLDYLADQFNYSPKYLSKLLNNHIEGGYKLYVSVKRIEFAKNLLTRSNKAIQEISESSGFNHRNSFVRTFKSIEGLSPSQYRTMYK